METPLAVANYFIQKSFNTGKELTPMKVVKLVYISHGWYLAITGQPLLNEPIQAWKYGPVIQSLYHKFKDYGNNRIDAFGYSTGYGFQRNVEIVTDKELAEFLDEIWEMYGHFNAVQLSSLTHQKGTPWEIVWNQTGHKRKEVIIPNDEIKKHYLGLGETKQVEH